MSEVFRLSAIRPDVLNTERERVVTTLIALNLKADILEVGKIDVYSICFERRNIISGNINV